MCGGDQLTESPRQERFARLYEANRRPVLAYAVRRPTSRDDAADVVAETFLVAWRHLAEVPEGETSLLCLYGAARGVLANLNRRAKRDWHLLEQVGREQRDTASRSPAPSHDAALLAVEGMAGLSCEDREILMLSAWEGLSSAQLGCVLDCSPTAARIRLYRARARLRVRTGERGAPRQDHRLAEPRGAKEVDSHEQNATVARP